MRRRGVVHLSEHLYLEIGSFRPIFLDKVRFRERLSHFRFEGQAVARSAGCHTILAERGPRCVNILPKVSLRIRRRVGCYHFESAGQVISGPACADDSCADDSHVSNLVVLCHAILLRVLKSLRQNRLCYSDFYLPANAGLLAASAAAFAYSAPR